MFANGPPSRVLRVIPISRALYNYVVEPSKEFLRFLKIMGINEHEHDKPVKWYHNSIEVNFHVAPFMNAEGHRRLCGNDRVIIFFKDEGESFDPTHVGNMGAMPQCFVVVQPVGVRFRCARKLNGSVLAIARGDAFRVGFFNRVSIHPFGPKMPRNHLWDATNLADYVLTKGTHE